MSDVEDPGKKAIPYPERGKSNAKPTQSDETPSRKKRFLRSLGIVTAVFFCVFCLAVGTVMKAVSNNPMLASIFRHSIVHPMTALQDPFSLYKPEEYLPGQHVINVLFLGCDYDYDEKHPVALKNKRGRSDAILMIRVDLDNSTINLINVPRDMAVSIPGKPGIHKINAAHSFGGPELTMETIQNVFGIKTDYYATVHFDTFQKIVDAVGGVDVVVKKKMDYDDNWGGLHVHLKPGAQHLDGYHAMGYVRFRHSDSDLMRAQRQQEFMQSLRKQVSSPGNFLKLPGVLNLATEGITTNMTQEQILTLAAFAKKLPRENIQLATMPVNEGPSFVYVKTADAEKLIRRVYCHDDPTANVVVSGAERTRVVAVSDERTIRRERRKRHSKTTTGEPAATEPELTITPDAPEKTDEKPSPPTDKPDEKKGGDSGGSPSSPPGKDAPPPKTDPPPMGNSQSG